MPEQQHHGAAGTAQVTTQGKPCFVCWSSKCIQPPAGVHVLMGEYCLQSRTNALRAEKDGRVRTVELVAGKPS